MQARKLSSAIRTIGGVPQDKRRNLLPNVGSLLSVMLQYIEIARSLVLAVRNSPGCSNKTHRAGPMIVVRMANQRTSLGAKRLYNLSRWMKNAKRKRGLDSSSSHTGYLVRPLVNDHASSRRCSLEGSRRQPMDFMKFMNAAEFCRT